MNKRNFQPLYSSQDGPFWYSFLKGLEDDDYFAYNVDENNVSRDTTYRVIKNNKKIFKNVLPYISEFSDTSVSDTSVSDTSGVYNLRNSLKDFLTDLAPTLVDASSGTNFINTFKTSMLSGTDVSGTDDSAPLMYTQIMIL